MSRSLAPSPTASVADIGNPRSAASRVSVASLVSRSRIGSPTCPISAAPSSSSALDRCRSKPHSAATRPVKKLKPPDTVSRPNGDCRAVGDARGRGWRQRPRHAACGRAGRGIPRQADRGGRGTGARGSCRPARAAVRARLPGGGDRRAMAVIHGRYRSDPSASRRIGGSASRIRCCAASPRARLPHPRQRLCARTPCLVRRKAATRRARSIRPVSDPPATTAAAALVEASRADGIRLICNNEEERYSGIRHCASWPNKACTPCSRCSTAPASIRVRSTPSSQVRELRHVGLDAAAQHRRGSPLQPCLPPVAELRTDERTPYRARTPVAPAAGRNWDWTARCR